MINFKILILAPVPTAKPCLETVGMDESTLTKDSIPTFKTTKDNKDYPEDSKKDLLPKGKGVPLRDGETEVVFTTSKDTPQPVGEVKLPISDEEIKSIKKVQLFVTPKDKTAPVLVAEFTEETLPKFKDNLLKGKNPVLTKQVTLRIEKKPGSTVNLKVDVKVCIHTTTVMATPITTTSKNQDLLV